MDRYKPMVHEVTATVRMGAEPSGEYVLAADAEARIRELEAALSKYGDHLPGCKREDMMPCNCGFATTLDRGGEPT